MDVSENTVHCADNLSNGAEEEGSLVLSLFQPLKVTEADGLNAWKETTDGSYRQLQDQPPGR